MKKISLLLVSLFICLMSWAQSNSDAGLEYGLNPYAYDVAVKSWDVSTKKLTLTFKVNAAPNLGSAQYTDGNKYNPGHAFNEGQGIQIYAIDPTNGEEYRIGGPGRTDIKNGTLNGYYEYTCTITGKCTHNDKTLPINKPLDIQVLVKGRNQGELIDGQYIGRANPELVTLRPSGFQAPGDALSVAIDKNPKSSSFSKAYITNSNSNTFWYYNAQMTDKAVVGTSTLIEPHRVRVSDDGRIFLSSYASNAGAAVVEYVGNGQFNTIVQFDPTLNCRVVSMDVKGSGENITLLVAWINNNGKVECWEYPLGFDHDNIPQTAGEKVAEYKDATLSTLLTQGVAAEQGFVGVAYGKGTNNPIWMKLDFAAEQEYQARILYYNNSSTSPKKEILMSTSYYSTTGYYGGNALLVTDNQLITAAGNGKVLVYDIESEGTLEATPFEVSLGEEVWMNDLAIDYAYNVYGVSSCNDNLYTIALPYSGAQGTIAPAKRSNIFAMPGTIPNILATDLRYAPHQSEDKYIFSFNVNTKPALAELRFYNSYTTMKSSINTVHGDLYDGTNATTPNFIYVIPTEKLRQGKISVELNMAGGKIGADGKLVGDAMPPLPPGEWYWSVYVEAPCRSTQFGVMYRLQGVTHATDGDQRRYVTVNNYPETDMFGSLFVGYNARTTDNTTRGNRGLHIHGINDNGNSNDEKTDITSTTRYALRETYLNKNMTGMINYPRRLTVGPDGKVFIADEGNYSTGGGATIQYHTNGGVKMWDPANPNKFTTFSDNILGTATGVAVWQHDSQWKLYATNTYDEFTRHGNNYTGEPSTLGTKDDYSSNANAFGRNGYVEHLLNGNFSGYTSQTQRHYKKGDASGNMGIVAMDKGVWLCQHREHTVAIKKKIRDALADNLDAYILAFMPYGTSDKTWTSCTDNGVNSSFVTTAKASDFSQKESSPVQSTPGGGIAYRKYKVAGGVQKEYLFIPNHDGNIARVEITSWSGNTPTVPAGNVKIFTTPEYLKVTKTFTQSGATVSWKTSFITSMEFDYAGNLVTTAGKGNHDAPQDIVIYTMPYPDRVNAQEIQAPNSCRFIPERLSQNNMEQKHIDNVVNPYISSSTTCTLDFFRPLQAGSFNSICLPFGINDLNATPYKGSTVWKFKNAELKRVGGETHLYFNFESVDKIEAGVPYLIKPAADVRGVVQFKNVQFTTNTSQTIDAGEYADFVGTFPQVNMDEPTTYPRFMVVSENRLAEIDGGTLLGFRSYFNTKKNLPVGTQSLLNFKKPTTTGTEMVVDGQTVNVEKFLREGRAYIRVGETLYTITGEVVGR